MLFKYCQRLPQKVYRQSSLLISNQGWKFATLLGKYVFFIHFHKICWANFQSAGPILRHTALKGTLIALQGALYTGYSSFIHSWYQPQPNLKQYNLTAFFSSDMPVLLFCSSDTCTSPPPTQCLLYSSLLLGLKDGWTILWSLLLKSGLSIWNA